MKKELTKEARYHSEKMPLAEINRRVQNIVGAMEESDVMPRNPNWLSELQDLFDDAGISGPGFALITDNRNHVGPSFYFSKGRLRFKELMDVKRLTADVLFETIRNYQKLVEGPEL